MAESIILGNNWIAIFHRVRQKGSGRDHSLFFSHRDTFMAALRGLCLFLLAPLLAISPLDAAAQGIDVAHLSFNAFGGVFRYGTPNRQEMLVRRYRSLPVRQGVFDQLTGKDWCIREELRLSFSPEGDPRLHDCDTADVVLYVHVRTDGAPSRSSKDTADAILTATRTAAATGKVKPPNEQTLERFHKDLIGIESLRLKFAKAHSLLFKNPGPWRAGSANEIERDGGDYVLRVEKGEFSWNRETVVYRFDGNGRLIAKEYKKIPLARYRYIWNGIQLTEVQDGDGKAVLNFEYANENGRLKRIFSDDTQLILNYDEKGMDVGADLLVSGVLEYQFRYRRNPNGFIEHFEKERTKDRQHWATDIIYRQQEDNWLVQRFSRVGQCSEEYSLPEISPNQGYIITIAEHCPAKAPSQFLRGELVNECRAAGKTDIAKRRLAAQELAAVASVDDPFEGDVPVQANNLFKLGFNSYGRPNFANGPGMKPIDIRSGTGLSQMDWIIAENRLKKLYVAAGDTDCN